jgi:hypothetical protein
MRRSIFILAAFLPLAGCAYGLGGMGGQDVLGSVLGGVLGGNRAMGGQSFQDAAVEACANEARRYGSVRVSDVRQVSSSTLRVFGTISTSNFGGQRRFDCDFREDGRITDFDVD